MSIADYLVILRRFWWVAAVCAALGAMITPAVSLVRSDTYTSTTQLFVSTQTGTSVGEAYQNNLFSQERVVSYAGLATSEQVAARAIDALDVDLSVSDLRSRVTATPVEGTVLLDVSVSDEDPETAQEYAQGVSEQLVELVAELETSRRGGSPAAGAVIVDEADRPTSPDGRSFVVGTLLFTIVGLLGGLVVAILVGLLDTVARRRERVEEATGELPIGVLGAPRRSEHVLADLTSGGARAEQVRELRTNLQFTRSDDGFSPQVIAVTSPSRGDGRTTVAANLAAALAETGQSVVLVDADLRQPGLPDALGLDDRALRQAESRGVSTVLAGTHTIHDAVIRQVRGPFSQQAWSLLPAGPLPSTARNWWGGDVASDLISTLRSTYDYVVLDTPALEDCGDGVLISALGDGGVVVVRLGHTRLSRIRSAIRAFGRANASLFGTVVLERPTPDRDGGRRPRRRDRVTAHTPSTTTERDEPHDGASLWAPAGDTSGSTTP